MEPLEVLGWLREHAAFSECHRVHSVYEGGYKLSDGSEIAVTLTIYEQRSNDAIRYYARAVSRDGKKMATGNTATTIEAVLAGLHWKDLG